MIKTANQPIGSYTKPCLILFDEDGHIRERGLNEFNVVQTETDLRKNIYHYWYLCNTFNKMIGEK